MEPTKHVIDVDETTFQTAVLEESQTRPILVDLWATWCEPCKTLGPALESVAAEMQGAILVATVDVDRSPRLAQAFGAQFPTAVAIYQGRPVDSFNGALPAQEVKTFANNVLTKCGLEVPGRGNKPQGEDVQALEDYWLERLAEDAKDGEALLELGRLFLRTERVEEAGEYLEKIRARMPQYDDAQAALKLRELMGEISAAGGEDAIVQRLSNNPTTQRAYQHRAQRASVERMLRAWKCKSNSSEALRQKCERKQRTPPRSSSGPRGGTMNVSKNFVANWHGSFFSSI